MHCRDLEHYKVCQILFCDDVCDEIFKYAFDTFLLMIWKTATNIFYIMSIYKN